MYIICDLNGKLIQRSNADVEDLQPILDRFATQLKIEVVGTTDEKLYSKTNETENFNVLIENGMIKDIEVHESPIITEPYKLTIEDRLTAVELALLEVL